MEMEVDIHRLIIESLDDAQAHCSCGHWHFCSTGAQTREYIQFIFTQDHPMSKINNLFR